MLTPKYPLMNLPRVEKSCIVHEGFVKIRCDQLCLPNQHRYQYYTLVTRADAALVIGITPDGLLVLTEEYRHPTENVLLSCAGGYLNDESENPCDAAQRELLEETGFGAEKFLLIGSAYPYPGISGQKIHYIVGMNAIKQTDPKLETTEIVQTVLMSREQLAKEIATGRPIDGNLCTALFFLEQNRVTGE